MAKKIKEEDLDQLVENIQFNKNKEVRKKCQKIIRQIAQVKGIYLASIYPFYQEQAKKEFLDFTVPAINLRGLTYESAKALIRAALKTKVKFFIVELARSEIEYTNQSLEEYAALVLAAAISQGFKGPLFLQGDHFNLNLKNYRANKEKEIEKLEDLIKEAIEAGFFNIDLDMSSLVQEQEKDNFSQQRENFFQSAQFTKLIRTIEPQGIDINIGAEVGEIGKRNTDVSDFIAFMKGYNEELSKLGVEKGISKIGIQNGVVHGGVVLTDGSLAKVNVDFDLLKEISLMARKEYGLAGAVQHGASTLPDELFSKFPLYQALEIHLATDFQNIIFDHAYFPSQLRKKIYQWLKENKKNEWKEGLTEAQFIYKTRKKAWGPFKKEIATIDKKAKEKIANSLEKRFTFLFQQLGGQSSHFS